MIKATYLVPTTGDRGPLLKHAIDSILRQSITELEVFVLGDGVNDVTRSIIKDLCNQDARIRFFDHPKHSRRGEPHRHAALQEAKGEIVCYMTDRDLLLPYHLELMWKLTRKYNFVKLNTLNVLANGVVKFGHRFRISGNSKDYPKPKIKDNGMFLSTVCHTLKLYQSLPEGWSTTPEGIYTDMFMWSKFLDLPDCYVYTDHRPGLLYFRRDGHPGWTTQQRLDDIQQWLPYAQEPELIVELHRRAESNLLNQRVQMGEQIDALKAKVKKLET